MRCALRFYLATTCMAALLVTSAVLPLAALASMKINEVLPAPASDWDGDLQADSKKDEWVEIVNDGPTTVDGSRYLLLNGESKALVYGFAGAMPPGAHTTAYGSDATLWESENGHSAIGLSLNNSGDVVWLAEVVGSDTVAIDSLSYSSSQVGYDVSLGRLPDGSSVWVLFDHFSPMGGNDADPTPGAGNSTDPAPHILEVAQDPPYPTQDDSVHITIRAGDAAGIARVVFFYQFNLENGEEPEMQLVSGTPDLGAWSYTILPGAPDDSVRYKAWLYDAQSSTVTDWMGYRVRSAGVPIKINEVLADPPNEIAGDANRDGVRDSADDEFVELVNCGANPVDISGWKLADGTSIRHNFPVTGMVVMPGEFVTVFGGGAPTGFSGKVFTASSGGLGLTNVGDVVSLLDRAGGLVDIHSYDGEGGKDQSMMLYPDCSGGWVLPSEAGLTVAFTPHEPNRAGSAVAPATWGSIKGLFK